MMKMMERTELGSGDRGAGGVVEIRDGGGLAEHAAWSRGGDSRGCSLLSDVL